MVVTRGGPEVALDVAAYTDRDCRIQPRLSVMGGPQAGYRTR
jgi:hypothetical protein